MVTRCTSWAYVAVVLLLTGISTAMARYSGGTGEPNDPYQIATAADLIALGETPNDYDKHFLLTADIDLDPNLPGRRVFDKAVIAGGGKAAFTGVFDGKGRTISHLTIIGKDNLGLFGYLMLGGQIENLGVENTTVLGERDVGGLVGTNYGTISNCYSTGAVVGNTRVGGLAGTNSLTTVGPGAIIDCHSTGSVSGSWYVGGLAGNNLGTISNCYSTGALSGSDRFIGGLVGANTYFFSGATLSNCYSTGSVSGGFSVGGLAGNNFRSTISNCYSTGSVSGTGDGVGGLAGTNDGTISNCYSSSSVSRAKLNSGGLVPKQANTPSLRGQRRRCRVSA